MSFSIDLWTGFDKLKERFTLTFNELQLLNTVFNTFVNMEKDYSKNLDSLYKDNKNRIEGEFLLEKSFIKLLDNIKVQSDYHKKHIDFISKYLIGPIKEVIDNQKSLFQLFSKNAKNVEILEKSKNYLIAKEEKYHSACNDLTNFLVNYDSNFFDPSFTENKSVINKRQKLINKINDYKNEYISQLYESNIDLDQYNSKTYQIMDELESKHESLLDLLKWSLINYANNKIALYDKVNYLYKAILKNYFSNIDYNQEFMGFIKKNVTKEFPISKFEFIAYKLNNININLFKENDRRQNPNECNRKINLMKKFFADNKLLVYTIPKETNNNDNNNENNIHVFSNTIKKIISMEKDTIKKPQSAVYKKPRNISQELNYFSLNNITNRFTSRDREDLLKSNLAYIEFFIDKLMLKPNETKKYEIDKLKDLFLLNKKENCIYFDTFIRTLNEYRARGKYVVSDGTYEILVDVFNFMLDNFQEQDNLLKNILILSQTFYFLRDNDKKSYIQRGIKNHKIFSSSKFWHRVINNTLSQNINNKDISQKVDKDKNETNKKLKIIALNTLIAYLCDLKCFTDDQKVFEEVKKFYCEIYDLDEKEVEKNVEISHDEMNISRAMTLTKLK